MAILLYFRKAREDTHEVEYLYGYPEMDRRMVINKDSLVGTPTDGIRDNSYVAVLTKITRIRSSQDHWPETGSYAA